MHGGGGRQEEPGRLAGARRELQWPRADAQHFVVRADVLFCLTGRVVLARQSLCCVATCGTAALR